MIAPLALGLALAAGDTTASKPRDDAWLAPDKVKHGVLAFAVQSGSYATVRVVGDHRSAVVAATAATLALSVVKELRDAKTTGFSVRDLVWDAAGIVVATLMVSHAPQR